MSPVLSRTFTLGRYTCVERLGQGPAGEVWRAKRFGLAGLDRPYLVYRIGAAVLAQDPTANLRLQAALRSVAEIQQQNLLRLEEFGSQGSDTFVAYEFVGFADLGKLKAGLDLLGDEAKALLPQLVALIGQQLARALAAAQERGVMHGLLGPSCVWIDQSGEAHLAELGLWSVLPQGQWKLDGALKPLASYLAPELVDSGVPGPRSEVFGLGSLLAELLRLAPIDKLTAESRAALPMLQALCQKATQKTAGQRQSNILELKAQLDAIRVVDHAQTQLQRFGQLFELAGDTVPQPVTTSDRSSAEPLPPPPSMRIAVGKPGEAAAKPGTSGAKAAAKPAVPTPAAAAKQPDAPDAVAKAATESPAKPTASPVSINPRAAFGAGMAGSAASAVTPTADVDAAEAAAVNSADDISSRIIATAKKRPSTAPPPETDTISVTDTNPAMKPLPRATPRRTARPSGAVGDEPTDQFRLAEEARRQAEEAQQAQQADPSTLDAGVLEEEENPALDSTGNYSKPDLPAIAKDDDVVMAPSSAAVSQSAAPVEPSPPPTEPKRLGTPAFIGIGVGAALLAGVVMFALIGRSPDGGKSVADGGDKPDGSAASIEPAIAKTPSDELQVDSTPAAAVFLDGEAKGKAPLKLKVKPGSHKLLLVADSWKLFRQEASGGQHISAKLVKAGLPDDVAGTAQVKVKCKRDGELRILVNGNDSGLSCPTDELMLKPGKYTLGFLNPSSDELHEKSLKVKKKGTKLKVKY